MTGQPAEALSTDRELLRRFAADREEGAFAALVQRHGAAVLLVCRRVLGNEADAEDVFQATFLVLSRKAGVVAWRDSVRNWLRDVARRLALQARAARRRSCGAVPERCDPHGEPLAEVARRELRLVLDEELGRLPEKYRAPVVLCYLEGKTNEQAAGELGWPTGSMSRRLARARALLRDRLSRRGLALAVTLGCLGLVALWLLRACLGGIEARPGVAGAMAQLGPAGGGGEDFEGALLRLAAGDRAEREDWGRLAQRAARVAAAVRDHDPGRRRADWQRLSLRMRRSALDLAEALAHRDEGTTRSAARRLAATCQNCHAIFRD